MVAMTRDPFGREKVRNARIIELCRAGLTLQQVGDQYDISRERIRQIVARAGVVAQERGRAVRAVAKRGAVSERRRIKRDQWAQSRYGCDYQTLIELNETHKTKQLGCYAQAYIYQLRNAAARGIPFRLTFPQWMQVWRASGHFHDRGRGIGKFCMSRFQDRGAYEVGNVYIQLATENSSEAIRRTLANGRMPWQQKAA